MSTVWSTGIVIFTFTYLFSLTFTLISRLFSQLPALLRAVHFETTLEEEHFDRGRQDQQKVLQEKVSWMPMITTCVPAGGA